MQARAIFHRKEACFEPSECEIEKVIRLSDSDFARFQQTLLDNYDFLREHADLMRVEGSVTHCLLVVGDSHTTVDPPEVIYFMREHYPDVIVDRHDTTMWQLIVKKGMPPTRMVRYCCDELKEGGGRGRIMVTGVRWAESSKRKNNRGLLELNNYTKKYVKLMNDNDEARRMFETCAMKSMHTLNPIIDWTQEEVWEYLHSRNIPYCKLYDEGFDRIGCIGCPLAGADQMRFEFARYPKYKQAYLRAFEKMLAIRRDNGKPYHQWQTAEDVMEWWLDEKRHPKVDADQLSLFSDIENPDAN